MFWERCPYCGALRSYKQEVGNSSRYWDECKGSDCARGEKHLWEPPGKLVVEKVPEDRNENE